MAVSTSPLAAVRSATGNRRSEEAPAPQRVGAVAWVLIALTLLPLIVEAGHVVAAFDRVHAISDNALNELVVRDIGRYPVLLGPFARDNWSHPGPLLYYLLWTPYRVFGSNSSAMLVGALLINGASIVAMIAIAKRWGGHLLAVPVAIACGLLVLRLPGGFLEDPWNPYVTVLPFGAFLLVAWAATCGDRWALPLAAFVGSFCVQTHIGYAAPVAAVALGCVWCIVRDRGAPRVGGGGGRRGLVALVWAAIVLVIVWAPPVVEQLTRSPGNIGSIVTYFRSPPQPTHGLADGFWVVAAQFGIRADWIRGLRSVLLINGQPAALAEHPLPLLLVPFLLACLQVFRRGPVALRRLGLVLLLPLPVGILAIADTIGPLYEYRLRWIWVLAALTTAFTVGVAASWLDGRVGQSVRRAAVVVALGGYAVLVVAGAVTVADVSAPNEETATMVSSLMEQVAAHLPDRPGVVLLRATNVRSINYLPAATLALERDGTDVKVKDDRAHLLSFGAHRLYRQEPVRALLAFSEDRGIERMARVTGARMIAYEGRVSPARRARALRELTRRWFGGETEGRHPTNAELEQQTRATAVFELPPSNAGFSAPSR